jgi:hypothetical protein
VASRAEALALALVSLFVLTILVSYVLDMAGFGLSPAITGALAAAAAAATASSMRRLPHGADLWLFVFTLVTTLGVLLWQTVPALLPTGSGPDLTHHLLLVDYIERHGALVHDPAAGQQLGEMADYTPGVHLLAVVSAAITGTTGFSALWPVVAASVALKFALFGLIALRLLPGKRVRIPLAMAGVASLLSLPALTLDSFARDSFLAQVVAELFALTMWWALTAWTERPAAWPALVYGLAGAAVFVTWPPWLGPLVIAFGLALHDRSDVARRARLEHAALALLPIAAVAVLHSASRLGAASIVATSGAVAQPSLAVIGWWLPLLAGVGVVVARRAAATRVVVWLAAGLIVQSVVLWLGARAGGAATPYMAIKMMYFAVYPLSAAAVIGVGALVRRGAIAWLLAALAVAGAVRQVGALRWPVPIVSHELSVAGRWARERLPPDCIDYLVANEYTAYWLHLAVLGNARLSERSADNDLYLTEPSFARWIVGHAAPPYAIAKRSVLPAEIRERTRVLFQAGDAIVIQRVNPTPDGADDTCVASSPRAGA